MKKNAFILGLLIVSTFSFAQHRTTPERASKQTERMKTELSLDDVQSKQIQGIHAEFQAKQGAVLKDSTLSREERQKQMRGLHQQKQEAIGKVLNDDQKTKWAAQRNAHTKDERGKHRGKYAQRTKESLNLTDDQASKMKTLDQEFGAKVRALRNDSTLTSEERRGKAKTIRNEYVSKLKTVLTEEQFKQWQARKAAHKRKRS